LTADVEIALPDAVSMQANRPRAATVWGVGMESSDWPPKKGPAREPGERMLVQ
jgi:hypothetical protein